MQQNNNSCIDAEKHELTQEEYARAYEKGFNVTVRFLISRGLPFDSAADVAQAAWVKGWEHRHQLRDPSVVATWANTIALNLYRTSLRSEPKLQGLSDIEGRGYVSSAPVDVDRVLAQCKQKDRLLLEGRYLEGYRVRELADLYGWSETAVRIRLLRARRSIVSKLQPKKRTKLSSLAKNATAAGSKRNAKPQLQKLTA